jgi:hypothetical protein
MINLHLITFKLKSLKNIVILFSTVAVLIGGLIVTPSYGQANTETSKSI